jgi:tRNA (guanosine-2'-O-)-methyltransferase
VKVCTHPNHADAFRHLRGKGLQILAADLNPEAKDFRTVDYTLPTAILLGAEKPGVSAEALDLADGTIFIPIIGAVESLNVSVAAAVILYEAQRQRQAAGLYEVIQLGEETRQRLLFEWGYRRLAETCRRRKLPYPRLGPEGELLEPLPGRP